MYRTLIGTGFFLIRGTYFFSLSQALPTTLSFSSRIYDGGLFLTSLADRARNESMTSMGSPTTSETHSRGCPQQMS